MDRRGVQATYRTRPAKECPRWRESLDVTSPRLDDELSNWDWFCREIEVRGSFSFSRAVETLPGACIVNGAAQTHYAARVTASAEMKRVTG